MRKKILLVFGTRPEAIKMAPLVREFRRYPELFDLLVCVTGQHRQMLEQVLTTFGIVPDFDLQLMRDGQDLTDLTARILPTMRDVLQQSTPDLVLVHGDTVTSMAVAMAAFYQSVPVAHVEAGLRTHNVRSPWPEEMNRQLTARLATYHLAPTTTARQNLLNENIAEEAVLVTGNTVIDALHETAGELDHNHSLQIRIDDEIRQAGYPLNRLGNGRRMVLITGHRRENFGRGFAEICQAIRQLALEFSTVDFVYPVHLNPNVREPVQTILSEAALTNVFLTEPLAYTAFVCLMKHCYLVLTDSGGIQEEAPGLGKPVLVMRDTTERPEAVEAGTVKLVGADYDGIVENVRLLLQNSDVYERMSHAHNPYGDGRAATRIVNFFREKLVETTLQPAAVA